MKNKTPQAMGTFFCIKTKAHPPSWPIKFIRTNSVAKNLPQPQDISMYSLCSDHCTHIRIPSSKNVEIRQALAIVGNTDRIFLNTCGNQASVCIPKFNVFQLKSKI